MQTSTFVWIVVVVVILLGVGWYLYAPQVAPDTQNVQSDTPATTTTSTTGTNEESTGADVGVGVGVGDASDQIPTDATVTYTTEGFTPREVTVKRGGSVSWTNDRGGNMWVATAQHPTHTVYAGTSLSAHCDDSTDVSFDQCKNGEMYTFTFDKVGTWGYHNHSNASHFGRVIVVE